MSHQNVLAYEARPLRVSRWAVAVFCMAIVSAVGFFLVVPALVTLIAAMIVRRRIATRTDIGGQGFAGAAVMISASSIFPGLVSVLLLTPTRCPTRKTAARVYCMVNLRNIATGMAIHASTNQGYYPNVAFAPYDAAKNEPRGSAFAGIGAGSLPSYFSTPFPCAGSVPACLWILVVNGELPAKTFVCRSDPAATEVAFISDSAGRVYDNFQNGRQLSYSFPYPWDAGGKVGAWWKSTGDDALPLAADMTPQQGTGIPARNLVPTGAPADPRSWNSGNHDGDGQNVVFADGHAEWTRTPCVGQGNDNIYSMSASPSKGPAEFGGIPAGAAAPVLTADRPPFDIVMLPVRDLNTGGM